MNSLRFNLSFIVDLLGISMKKRKSVLLIVCRDTNVQLSVRELCNTIIETVDAAVHCFRIQILVFHAASTC